ncbi:MAG: peptidoglycan-binding domain-containing protein [Candidatus Paceibacterota bacterium]
MDKIFFKKIIISFLLSLTIGLSLPFSVFAFEDFFVDSSYDLYNRKEVETEHIIDIGNARFFIDKDYYLNASLNERVRIEKSISSLGEEFKNKIYPNLTSLFGKEPAFPDGKITVVFHQMPQGTGGYFNTGDQYSRYQYSRSNEKNILFLNVFHIHNPLLPSYLAHEFTHLITFNQKENIYGVSEEIWLNELRADYAVTYLGYDNNYKGSNLENRVNQFLKDTNASLTEWTNRSADYGIINLFAQYLVDHYGVEILAESLKSPYVGIEGINYALKNRGFRDDFSDIFTNWTIALFLNDCGFGEKYCYKKESLKNIRVLPQTTYLPQTTMAQIIISVSTKQWSGNWQRIVGGQGDLVLNFKGEENLKFKIPYLICKNGNSCSLLFLSLDESGKGKIDIKDFDDFTLTIIPSIQDKTKGFDGPEKTHYFSFDILTKEREIEENQQRAALLERIESLKQEVKRLEALIEANQGERENVSCSISNNLYFGIINSNEVSCLQEFLKSQGHDIYPEGLITGNFLSLTRNAVVRFQKKYASEILAPFDLISGTGFVGQMTRNKIENILKESY